MMTSSFLWDLGFNFKIGLLVYKHLGSLANLVVVWKMNESDNESSQNFQGHIVKISRELPILFSQWQTKDAIDAIAFSCTSSKSMCRELIEAILPDHLTLSSDINVLNHTTKIILTSDNNYKLDLLSYMWQFNCRGNSE